MENADEHHEKLHIEIERCLDLADWIYHDVRLNCDGEALPRTAERLADIQEQIGLHALYGIAAGWASRTSTRVIAAYKRMGKPAAPIKAMLEDNMEMEDVNQRNYVTAVQFISAVSNDDLEMSEALFNAAANSSEEDFQTFMRLILGICIQVSSLAKRSGRLQA